MESTTYSEWKSLVRDIYGGDDVIPLHAPVFHGREKEILCETIDSTFVSTVGRHVTTFESMIAERLQVKHAIAMMNGTAALHMALVGLGVCTGDEVLTQSLSFVATSNAIRYCGAQPVFLDIDEKNLGLSVDALRRFLEQETIQQQGNCINRKTGRIIRACVPMHTFGLALDIEEIAETCRRYSIALVEDAAEALGSRARTAPCGSVGDAAVLSFNGNKIITTGGGGMVVTDDDHLAERLRHLSTTARTASAYTFSHDEVGYNYRMPNLNAALGIAQLEQLDHNLEEKRKVALAYQAWAKEHGFKVYEEPEGTRSNYWLNAMLLDDVHQRDVFLQQSNRDGIQIRAFWDPLHSLPMYNNYQHDGLKTTTGLVSRGVNLPSGVPG